MRYDKYNPVGGGFRAPVAAAWTGDDEAFGVGLNSSGQVVKGDGQTGIVGVVIQTRDVPILTPLDIMKDGEIVEFGGVAGTRYYADRTTGVISAGVFATLATGIVGSNNAITWTARQAGEDGNGISVTLVDPAGNNGALSVLVTGNDIVVTCATDGSSAIASTAAQVIAAIQADPDANALVKVANTSTSTGAALVTAVAKTSLASGAGEVYIGHTVEAGRLIVGVK